MLGNDIVDFYVDEKKYHNPRYLQRILTTQERTVLSKATVPNRFLWSLWAAKEAGFKAAQRLNPELTFSPVAYELCKNTLRTLLKSDEIKNFSGALRFNQQLISLQFNYPADTVVHCVACCEPDNWACIDHQSRRVAPLTSYQQQADAVRDLAHDMLTGHNIQAEIIKPVQTMSGYEKPGAPILLNPVTHTPLPHIISLSHDHDYVAVALYCPPFALK